MAKSTRKYGKRSGKKNGGDYDSGTPMGNNGLNWSNSFTIRRFLRMPRLSSGLVGGNSEKVLQIYILKHEIIKEGSSDKLQEGTLTYTFKNCDFDAAVLLVNKMRSLFYDIGIELGSNYISKGPIGWSTDNNIVMKYQGNGLTEVSIQKEKNNQQERHVYNIDNIFDIDKFNNGFNTIKEKYNNDELAVSSFETNYKGLSSGIGNVGDGTGQSKSWTESSIKPQVETKVLDPQVPVATEQQTKSPPAKNWWPPFGRRSGGKSKRRRTPKSKRGSRKSRR